MKRSIFFTFVMMMFVGISLQAQITNTVTFVADLTDMISQGFDSTTDTLEIRGLDWEGTDGAVTGDRFLTVDPNNANLYQTTLVISSAADHAVGDSLRWKFHGYPEANFDPAWEPGVEGYDGRPYIVQADGATSTEEAVVPKMAMFVGGITNVVTFKADLTDIFGTGSGVFDPALDGIEVRGFWGDGADVVDASVIAGETSPMVRNLDPGVVYETTVTLQLPSGLPVGTQTSFKFKTFPDERWADGGWEIGSNTLYTFQEEGAEVEVMKKPNVFPKGEALGKEVNVLFQCFMPEDALNRYDSSAIPRDDIEFIILKGDNPAIGIWGGDWVADDTLTAGAVALYDNGANGDITAGDYVFSNTVTFADTILSGGVIYKFGAQYPDAGTVIQSAPLDNSLGIGQNFSFIIQAVDTTIVLFETWPSTGTPVGVKEVPGQLPTEYTLTQNYPNPFNPSTTIRYSIPAQSNVTLKVYNVLGMEAAVLVEQNQSAGQYEVSFDASSLASGIYFYTLETAGATISKKMMLMK